MSFRPFYDAGWRLRDMLVSVSNPSWTSVASSRRHFIYQPSTSSKGERPASFLIDSQPAAYPQPAAATSNDRHSSNWASHKSHLPNKLESPSVESLRDCPVTSPVGGQRGLRDRRCSVIALADGERPGNHRAERHLPARSPPRRSRTG